MVNKGRHSLPSYIYINKKVMAKYTKSELQALDTIEQAWDGDELKIDNGDHRIWLTHRENKAYNGDYVVETRANGKWEQVICYFE